MTVNSAVIYNIDDENCFTALRRIVMIGVKVTSLHKIFQKLKFQIQNFFTANSRNAFQNTLYKVLPMRLIFQR